MVTWWQSTITIVVAIFASTGFWQYIQYKNEKKDARTKMILGLAHDRLLALCTEFLKRGSIGRSEYENLKKYLYEPYIKLGGNGVVKHMVEQVDKLPVTEG